MSDIRPWPQMNMVPLDGLEAWHCDDQYLGSGSIAANGLMPDVMHGRHVTASSNKPVITDDIPDINEQRGWYFNGTRNPMCWSGSITLSHLFVVVSFADTEFAESLGIVSGLTSNQLLVTSSTGTSLAPGGGESLLIDGIASGDTSAPVDGTFSLVEILLPGSAVLDGLCIGALPDGTGKHNGHIVDSLAYSRVVTDLEKQMIHRYAASRYHIWEKTLDA